eukprot:TRINITY_DN7754_c0_g1_i2.p1 TRINITY_DN7754_c0_g1~~TRINITY_DN7754_c0_g1_i2.p1  ORF type:complete len:723 (-),score=175.63 TRINITY_DN7754_c0_g1_i2:89-2257(-)
MQLHFVGWPCLNLQLIDHRLNQKNAIVRGFASNIHSQFLSMSTVQKLAPYTVLFAIPTPASLEFLFPWLLLVCVIAIMASLRFNVESKAVVSLCGVLNVLISLACTFGLFMIFQGFHRAYTLSAIFFVIIIGMDDVFVMINAVHRQKGTPTKRLARGLGEAASSILMTTLTDIMIFGPGIWSASPMTGEFFLFICLGLLTDFALQLTFFTAILFLDLEREHKNRSECCCCCSDRTKYDDGVMRDDDLSTGTGMTRSTIEVVQLDGERKSVSMVKETGTGTQTVIASTNGSTVETTVPQSNRSTWSLDDVDDVQLLDSWISRGLFRYGKLLATKPGKAVSFVITIGLIVAAVYGIFFVQFDVVEDEDLHPGTGKLAQWRRYQQQSYPNWFTNGYVYFQGPLDYHSLTVQQNLLDICSKISQIPSNVRLAGFEADCWIKSFQTWNNNSLPTDQDTFVANLKQMLGESPYDHLFRPQVMFEDDGKSISETRIEIKVKRPEDVNSARKQNQTVYDTLGSKLPYGFVTLEITRAKNILDIESSIHIMVIISGILVLLVSGVLLINPFTAFIVLLGVMVTGGTTLAVLKLVSTPMNSVVLFSIPAIIGLGVDFAAHLIHSFNTTPAFTVQKRLQLAMAQVGPAIVYGALTNISVMLMMINNESAFFFGMLMTGTASFVGLIFAMVAVPMFLLFSNPPIAIRNVSLEEKLRKKTKPVGVDDVWKRQFKQ